MSIFHGFLLLFFMAFSVGVFFVSNLIIFAGIFAILLVLLLMFELKFPKLLRLLLLLLPIISISLAFNYLINRDLDLIILVLLRLYAISIASFVYANTVTTMKFITGLMFLLQPLRLLRIKIRDIAVTIAIAIAFIPVLRKEYIRIRQGMHAKGRRFGLRLTLGILLYKVLYRASNLSLTLDAKGYY